MDGPMNSKRLSNLCESLQSSTLPALALGPGPSLTYLTGLHFHLSERPVVMFFPAEGTPGIVLPELEMLKLEDLPFEIKAFPYGENPAEWESIFLAAGKALGLEGKVMGVEPRSMRLLEFNFIKAVAGKTEYQDAGKLVGALRLQKDANEIEAIRKAVKIAQAALEATLPVIKIGMAEKEIASELVLQLLRARVGAGTALFPDRLKRTERRQSACGALGKEASTR